jgi:Tfp pilus assembly protein PilO
MPAASQLRAAWLVVTLVALLGFASVVAPAQQRIAAIESHGEELADLATRNEALLSRIGSLEQTRKRVRIDLQRLAGKSGGGRVAVAALQVLEDEAARNHLTISSIAPASEQISTGAPRREEDVSVSLRGRYRDLMAAIADVPHHDVLVEVQSVTLQSVATRQVFPSVDATIRAALYPEVKDLAKEDTHAQTAAQ